MRHVLAVLLVVSSFVPLVRAQDDAAFAPLRFGDPEHLAYREPFVPGASYDASIPTPDALLGDQHGRRLTRHDEILACFEAWAEASPRMTLHDHGVTHEGRRLVHAIITSPENHARLEAIRNGVASLSDPRGLSEADAQRIVETSPAVAWLGYGIHGDELSASDGAVAVAYHYAACTDADVVAQLDDVVIVLDPCLNPDGRTRIIDMVEQMSGRTTSLDYASMQRGRWPWGRGNHYLFDLNRDWMTGSQPETRARWEVLSRWRPQLFVDGHEMSAQDTFLFYPQAEPFNPQLPEKLGEWQRAFAADAAASFDAYGWAYYTREWADAWAPFYSDAWGSLNGAIGILYEQASTSGFPQRRASGRVFTYREAVHGQVAASLANVATLAERRAEVLADYAAARRRNVEESPDRMVVVLPGRNPDRDRMLLRALLGHGVEIHRSRDHVTVTRAVGAHGDVRDELDVPPGAWLVPLRQPQAPLISTYFAFDTRMDVSSLERERAELERNGRSNIYDDTAWSLLLALDVDALWCDGLASGELDRVAAPVTSVPTPVGSVSSPTRGAPVAWVVDGSDDASVRFAARAMEHGVAVHLSDKAFSTGGRSFARGSLLVRANENDADVAARVALAADEARVTVYATSTGLSPDEGPDLGGGHFTLLSRPRVALIGNAPVRSDTFGHVWHHLDVHVGTPIAMLDAASFGSVDLRRYNVLVVPPAAEAVVVRHGAAVADWVRDGGTLVACGSAAGALASATKDAPHDVTAVTRRRDALKELEAYAFAAERELSARVIDVDVDDVWPSDASLDGPAADDDESTTDVADAASADVEDDGDDDEEDDAAQDAAREDAWKRRFAPRGVYVTGHVDHDSWLTVGLGERLPCFVDGSVALLSREPVRTAVRLADEDALHVAGLLWPEARERLAHTAYATHERVGRGQVVLLATIPGYRGTVLSSGRLLGNAVVYGPGAGADAPIGW